MFEIEARESGVLAASGRLDASQVNKAEELIGTAAGPLTIDLEELDYISSAGIGVLLRAYKRLTADGKDFKLINPRPHIRNIFHYAGLDQVFTIE